MAMTERETNPLEQRLREALAEEHAAGWPFYDRPTRRERGRESAQYHLPILLRALERAGLVLAEGRGVMGWPAAAALMVFVVCLTFLMAFAIWKQRP